MTVDQLTLNASLIPQDDTGSVKYCSKAREINEIHQKWISEKLLLRSKNSQNYLLLRVFLLFGISSFKYAENQNIFFSVGEICFKYKWYKCIDNCWTSIWNIVLSVTVCSMCSMYLQEKLRQKVCFRTYDFVKKLCLANIFCHRKFQNWWKFYLQNLLFENFWEKLNFCHLFN